MEIMGIEEKALRANLPIHLWTSNGKAVHAKVASIVECEEWLDEAAKVEEADKAMGLCTQMGDIDGARAASKEFRSSLLDALKKYPGIVDDDFKGATWSQLMGAFWLLKTLSDPFDFSQAMTEAVTRQRLEMIPRAALEEAISVMGKRQALSGSANGSTSTPS